MNIPDACPSCGGNRLRVSEPIVAAGNHGPVLLPGTSSGFLHLFSGRLVVVVCIECGLTRFFAPREECDQIAASTSWSPLVTPPRAVPGKHGFANDPSAPS